MVFQLHCNFRITFDFNLFVSVFQNEILMLENVLKFSIRASAIEQATIKAHHDLVIHENTSAWFLCRELPCPYSLPSPLLMTLPLGPVVNKSSAITANHHPPLKYCDQPLPSIAFANHHHLLCS
ncbi:hypothetical protein RHGRI_013493 [Rhododendron griersonianum]|uniref:Uncharacterized protein n=1 Tax=Rhododendron griersonianum TaxID=479676 RepID=A0AAV6K5S6_9ERIC|nr:hypothetical protein RHGRI_013493 [Rhododendron griersonianum]